MLYDVKESNPQLEIDWRAYFYRFVQEHGEPVEVSPIESDRFRIYSRLLFRDGWMYGAMDYQGPEFSPPGNPDQLRKLKLEYWTIEKKAESEHPISKAYSYLEIGRLQEHSTPNYIGIL